MYRILSNILIIALLAIAVSGCSSVKELKIFETEVPRAPLNLPHPEAAKMEPLQWVIITSENAEEVFKKLEEAGIDPVLFGITDKDFQVLARNFAQIRQKLQETNNLLQEYQKYYEEEDNADSN